MTEKDRDLGDTINSMQSQIASNFVLIQALIELLEEKGVDKEIIIAKYEKLYKVKSDKIFHFFDTGESDN